MLDSDARSRYLGEFAIGTNFGIQQFTGSILFVTMKIGAGRCMWQLARATRTRVA